MKYSCIASSNKNFQSSVNLQFDLNKKDKIDTYIPTLQSVSILKRYLNAVYNNGYNEDNATVLIGPYGRGKSHLLLVLSAIMSGENSSIDKNCLEKLINKIRIIDPEAAELANMIINRNKPMLPVIISSNYTDINQSFIMALREALERNKLEDFFPETYFDSALSMINTWEEQYDKAFSSFAKCLKEHKTTPAKIKYSLSNCSRESYELFCKVYPYITNGAEFNPMSNSDIVKIYTQVSAALCEQKNYSGIYIIFDEFSKFLESTAAVQNKQNLKLIQDFAELAVRSGEAQTHLCCVTHKEILDYSQSDSFRTVDGRFKKVYFVATSEQSYELIANAIELNGKFEDFFEKHSNEFNEVKQSVYMTNIFCDIDETFFNEYILKKCFPLHPIAAFSLIKISELVGQNERTIFTFLSQSEEHSLAEFLCKERKLNEFALLTIDYIFDYFSDLFRVEIFNSRIHSIWAKANTALKQTSAVNEQKIIKSLAIINIINEDIMPPVSSVIKAAVNLDNESFNFSIEQLNKNHIIAQKRDRQFTFLTPNGVDIRKSIKDKIEQGLVKSKRIEILSSAYSTPYILPRQYNSEKKMMRYFRTIFMEAKDFWNCSGNFSEQTDGADGLLINLVTDSFDETMFINDKLEKLGLGDNIITCVSENWTENDLLQEYSAACLLEKSKEAEDSHFYEELLLYKDELFKSIQELVNKIYSPTNEATAYYTHKECLQNITKPMLLNRELSHICDMFYCHTPVINNEMINKNHLTAPIKKARAKAINWIISHSNEIPEIEGHGPEVSVFRSTISVHGLNNQTIPKDKNLSDVLQLINDFLIQAETKSISFSEIYDTLTAAPYGMRKGVIPIYLSYAIRMKMDNIVIYFKSKEVELSGELFNDIGNCPDDYSCCVETGTKEKDEYINGLIRLFDDKYVPNNVNPRSIALKLMQSWFRGLPKFSRTHSFTYTKKKEKIKEYIPALRKYLLLYDINPYDFLFDTIPQIFNERNYSSLLNYIKKFVLESNNFIEDVKKYTIKLTINQFSSNIQGSLSSVIRNWFGSISDEAKKNVFDADTNYIIKFAATNNDFDEMNVISSLAKNITTLAIEDWNDDTIDTFIGNIRKSIDIVNNYEQRETGSSKQQASISLNIDGVTYERNIADTEISPIAETTLNNIEEILEDYGDSITAQERISVLLKLLQKEIDQI